MYKIGDYVYWHGMIYEVVKPHIPCWECSFGYDDDDKFCFAPDDFREVCDKGLCQFKFTREATDQECLDNADLDVLKKDDEQLIMF